MELNIIIYKLSLQLSEWSILKLHAKNLNHWMKTTPILIFVAQIVCEPSFPTSVFSVMKTTSAQRNSHSID